MYLSSSKTQSIPLAVSPLKGKHRKGRNDGFRNTEGKKKKKVIWPAKITNSIQKHVFKQYEKVMHFNIFYKCIKYTEM